MSPPAKSSELAPHVAERLHVKVPWDVIGERVRRFEIHLQGTEVELVRGPVTVEGYGVRLFTPRGDHLAPGFHASTDLSAGGIAATVREAESVGRFAEFPARSVELPTQGPSASTASVVDQKLWRDPLPTLEGYVHRMLEAFRGRSGVVPSFGSVKATLSEESIANSAGANVAFASTYIELEIAVKASGGPEGPAPGEFWVNESFRRLEPDKLAGSVDAWCRYATDVRRARAPPSGSLAVVLPSDVLSGILLPVLGSRFSGAARLRKIAPEVGTPVGPERLTVRDDGTHPWSVGSAPYDDEGTVQSRRSLIENGVVTGHLYDALYAAALGTRSTGNAVRTAVGPSRMLRFAHAAAPGLSTLVVGPGDGGSTDELVAAAQDGVYVAQLGWASPDPISSAFGGEIRIGYRIRGGKLAEPVRGGTVGGVVLAPPQAPSLFANLAAIGSRTELSDALASPPMLVRPLTVAGATG